MSSLQNPYLFLPKFTSALRVDDPDSDATLNLFTYAVDAQRNYADLNQRIDSFASYADVIVFQNAQNIDLPKILSGLPNMGVFQNRSTGLALAVRETGTRVFRNIQQTAGTISGTLIVQGYQPIVIATAVDAATATEFTKSVNGLVAIGGPWSMSVPGYQHGGSLLSSDNWYVRNKIKVRNSWVGAVTLTGNRPTAIKVELPRDSKPVIPAVKDTPGSKPTPQGSHPSYQQHSEAHEMKIMTVNFHVGIGVNDQWFNMVDRIKPTVILGQECVLQGFGRLKSHLSHDYFVAPGVTFNIGREAGQTPVLMRKDAFVFIRQGNRLVSQWRGGGDHGRQWPTRFSTWMECRHKASGKIIKARSFHAWVRGDKIADDGRDKQFGSLREWCRTGDHVIAGGDFNAAPEQIQREYLGSVNMHLSAQHTPDAIFTRGLAVMGSESLVNPSGEAGHKILVLRANV